MDRIILSKRNTQTIISGNKVSVSKNDKFIARKNKKSSFNILKNDQVLGEDFSLDYINCLEYEITE